MTMVTGGRVIGLDISGTFGGGMRGALVDGEESVIARKDAITPKISQDDLIEALATMAGRLADQAQREGAPASASGVAVPRIINEAPGVGHRSPHPALPS